DRQGRKLLRRAGSALPRCTSSLRHRRLEEVTGHCLAGCVNPDHLEVVPTRAPDQVTLARVLTPPVDDLLLAAVAPDELVPEGRDLLAGTRRHPCEDDILAPEVADRHRLTGVTGSEADTRN